jgi:hypothetical protein
VKRSLSAVLAALSLLAVPLLASADEQPPCPCGGPAAAAPSAAPAAAAAPGAITADELQRIWSAP